MPTAVAAVHNPIASRAKLGGNGITARPDRDYPVPEAMRNKEARAAVGLTGWDAPGRKGDHCPEEVTVHDSGIERIGRACRVPPDRDRLRVDFAAPEYGLERPVDALNVLPTVEAPATTDRGRGK
jgi:hypothetical protein